jgi:hypothetical protein
VVTPDPVCFPQTTPFTSFVLCGSQQLLHVLLFFAGGKRGLLCVLIFPQLWVFHSLKNDSRGQTWT